MKADPNGAVSSSEILGREAEAERLWTTLTQRSAILEGRVGIGKTTVIRKAFASPPAGWSGRLVALGELDNPLAAAAALIDAAWDQHPEPGPALRALVEPLLGTEGRVTADAVGMGDGEHEDSWDALLRDCIDTLMQEAEGTGEGEGVVLALEDFDGFCARVMAKGFGPSLGVLVAVLGELCEMHPRLRLLVSCNTSCERLFERVYPRLPAQPIDGFARLRIEALSPESSARLVSALLLGESITARDRAATARKIAVAFDGVPRWIHCAMAEFVRRRRPIVDGDVEAMVESAAKVLEGEPWQLRRELAPVLDDYWEPQRGLALAVLDMLAGAEDGALEFRALRQQLAIEMTIDDDAIRRVVVELGRDQLVEEFGGQLRFCGELLRRAWAVSRGLA